MQIELIPIIKPVVWSNSVDPFLGNIVTVKEHNRQYSCHQTKYLFLTTALIDLIQAYLSVIVWQNKFEAGWLMYGCYNQRKCIFEVEFLPQEYSWFRQLAYSNYRSSKLVIPGEAFYFLSFSFVFGCWAVSSS